MKLDDTTKQLISLAVKEDVGTGDVTSNSIVPKSTKGLARIVAKEKGIVCGMDVAEYVCKSIDKNLRFTRLCNEGEGVNPKQIIARIEGSFNSILTAERTILNFLQRMSGIASETNKYVAALKGTKSKLLDTRKTTPGHRALDKYAVKVGGGNNHRAGLFDMILIKENHISAAGSISKAVKLAKLYKPKRMKIEIEAATLTEVKEALAAGVDIIMLDNMNYQTMKRAVQIVKGSCETEASGGINLKNINRTAQTGVNFISVGALTHSFKSLDIAMYIQQIKN
jgi:nicotinate-nucleotide pyrophosphorylase (carboxylating)